MKKKCLKIPFVKMNGAGNDFVLIDNRRKKFSLKWNTLARTVCDRRFGIGADGLLILERSTKTDFKMLYYNADGSSGGMCGNGGRCASAYVMDQEERVGVMFDAVGYTYLAKKIESEIWLKMKNPNIIFFNESIAVLKNKILASYINTGSPHVVLFETDLAVQFKNEIHSTGIIRLGKAIRYLKLFFPQGTNVNFIKVLKRGLVAMRTYERGVEDETLACGTGAVASAIISSLQLGWSSPIKIRTFSEKILTVRFRREGDSFADVILCGPVQYSFTGEFLLD